MSDKLQFVAGFHQSHTAENFDKLKFVGHFLSLPAVSLGTALVVHFDTLAMIEGSPLPRLSRKSVESSDD